MTFDQPRYVNRKLMCTAAAESFVGFVKIIWLSAGQNALGLGWAGTERISMEYALREAGAFLHSLVVSEERFAVPMRAFCPQPG
jgi:hypothetical protein